MSQTETHSDAPPAAEISRLTEHLFRQEAGKLVSVLTGIFGIERLQMAEDVVQEALVRALQTWPYYGIPQNPAAWLTQTAKNLALDLLRREKVFHEKQTAIITHIEQRSSHSDSSDAPLLEGEIRDDRLRLMFACCHPLVPQESQAALALKTLCGFSPREIATAFVTSEAAIEKRLVRARERIRELNLRFEIPAGEELASRLDSVLQTLYLLFNEGYKASSGESLIREELCYEAIRLTTLLAEQLAGNQARTHALLALMFFNAARFSSRTDPDGNLLRLKEQDRSAWDKAMIAHGMLHLGQSARGGDITAYHLQAGIAACHCAAKNYESTDWQQIQGLYDQLIKLDDSPIIALNRAVAVGKVQGPAAGLKALTSVQQRDGLKSYHLLYAVLGEFEAQLNHTEAAAEHFRKSLALAELKSERRFLLKRLQETEARSVAAP